MAPLLGCALSTLLMRLKIELFFGIGFVTYPTFLGSWLEILTWSRIKRINLVVFPLPGSIKRKFTGTNVNINLICLILWRDKEMLPLASGLPGATFSKGIIGFIPGLIGFMLTLIFSPFLPIISNPLFLLHLLPFLIIFLLLPSSILGMLFLLAPIIMINLFLTLPYLMIRTPLLLLRWLECSILLITSLPMWTVGIGMSPLGELYSKL